MKKWKKLSTEIIHKNPWWEYWLDRFELPSGKEGEYNYMHTTGSTLTIVVDKDARILWTGIYRYLFDASMLELAGGGIEAGETPEQTAQRELLEETGVEVGQLELVAKLRPQSGLSDETQHVFVAWNIESKGDVQPDELEGITEQRWMSVSEVDQAIRSGEITCSMSIAAWTVAKPRVLELVDQISKKD